MEHQLEHLLTAVASDTMEKLAFLFASPDEERMDDGPGPADIGRVRFNGHFGGTLTMRISSAVAPELAVNMLGLDDDARVSPADQKDALQEMLNIICGNLLPALAGDQAVFDIEAPEIFFHTDAGKPEPSVNAAAVARLVLEEGFCDLFLSFKGDPPLLDGSENDKSINRR